MASKNKKKETAPADKIASNVTIKKLPGSKIEITGSIPTANFAKYRGQAIKNINQEVTIDGFRKGNVPEKVLIQKVGEMTILYEMAELAISEAYPQIIIDEKLDVISRPQINITKIAADNDLEFKIETAVSPTVDAGDYKKIGKEHAAKKPEKVEVTDEDINRILEDLRRSHAERLAHDEVHPEESDGHHHAPVTKELIEKHLPELNDDFAKVLGNFTSLDDLKKRIRENVQAEKEQKAIDKRRLELADALVAEAKIDLPQALVDAELNRSEAQFRDDIARMGLKVEDYLKHIKKSIEDLRNEWTEAATKKAKLQLILNAIAIKENLRPTPEAIEAEVQKILEYYADADRERAAIYAETVLANEMVFEMLEGTEKKSETKSKKESKESAEK